MKNRFSKLIEKDGFYIILFICVCVVAITAVWASRKNLDKEENQLSKAEDFIIIDDRKSEPSLEIARMEKDLMMDREISKVVEEPEEQDEQEEDTIIEGEEEKDLDFVEEEAPPVNSNTQEGMTMPVDGKIGMDFTTDNLIYSETLEEWTSHKGIDIFAQEGEEVKAVLSGEVVEVYEDPLWGIVTIIDHGNGLMTKYANLSTGEMIEEGFKVTRGQVINKVGKSASIEMMMNPHIHFEVIKDGVNVDPKDYLPVSSHLN